MWLRAHAVPVYHLDTVTLSTMTSRATLQVLRRRRATRRRIARRSHIITVTTARRVWFRLGSIPVYPRTPGESASLEAASTLDPKVRAVVRRWPWGTRAPPKLIVPVQHSAQFRPRSELLFCSVLFCHESKSDRGRIYVQPASSSSSPSSIPTVAVFLGPY